MTVATVELDEVKHYDPSCDEFDDTVAISPVYQVGDLDGERQTPYTSHEGRGVSVSVHPDAWKRIIRADGTSTHESLTTYTLRNPEGKFYYIDPSEPLDVEQQWCVDHGYVDRVSGYRVTYEDEVSGTAYMEFRSEETARMEADAREGSVEETQVLTLGPSGIDYWLDAFRQPPENADPVLIAGLTPVWYAKSKGYDGVWWDEQFDPQNYSAPRGVIFQSELKSWDRMVVEATTRFEPEHSEPPQ